MAVETYRWPALPEFRNRAKELAEMERWWASPSREPLNLYGRRRVGKSWLFRSFADGKPTVILVADRVVAGQQLTHLSDQLYDIVGVRPRLDDVSDLFTLIYELAADQKILVVIDEFPYLLGTTVAEQERTLAAIQAVMERKRDASKVKLILTGSTIAQMEALQAEKSPLHGRLVPLSLWPLPFAHATLLMDSDDPVEQLTRYAIAGGMPRYLTALGRGDISTALVRNVIDPHSQLFNEARTLLQTEVRESAVYFSILAELAGNPKSPAKIAAAMRMETRELSPYLVTLESLRLAARRRPNGSNEGSRDALWRCTDNFVRFWFRFVQPYQAELEAGGDPRAHVELNVMPYLADHAAPAFEEVVTAWMRQRNAGASGVGAWWGPALNRLRRTKERLTEEIDTVALFGRKVAGVAEAKWTTKALDTAVLSDLLAFKLPALVQAGFDATEAEIVLASRSGFTDGLRRLARKTPRTVLIDAKELLNEQSPRVAP